MLLVLYLLYIGNIGGRNTNKIACLTESLEYNNTEKYTLYKITLIFVRCTLHKRGKDYC